MPRPPRTAVVVPLKGGPLAKSRLSMPRADRLLLADAFARDTLAAVAGTGTEVLPVVVTGDPAIAAWAAAGAEVVADPREGLDAAVAAGLRHARGSGCARAAVLLGDHPSLRPDELTAALEAAVGATVVPDTAGAGTAVLLVPLDGDEPRPTAFGPGSAAAHEALGYRRADLDAPGLRTDVDDAASLWAAVRIGVGATTAEALARVTLPHVQATIHRSPGDEPGSALLDDGVEVVVPAAALADSGMLHVRVGQRVSVELGPDGRVATRVWIVGIGPGQQIR